MMEDALSMERMDVRNVKTEPNEILEEEHIRVVPKEAVIVRRHRK